MPDVVKKGKNLSQTLIKAGNIVLFVPAVLTLIFWSRLSFEELFLILMFYLVYLMIPITSSISYIMSTKKQKLISKKKSPSKTLASALVLFVIMPSVIVFFVSKASPEESSVILFLYLSYNIVRFYFFLNLRSLNNKMYFFLDLALGVAVLSAIMAHGEKEILNFMLFIVLFTCSAHYIFMPPPDASSKKAAKKRIHDPCFVLKLYFKHFINLFNKRQIKDVAVIKDGINSQKQFLDIITKPHGTVNTAKKLTAVVNEQYAQNKHALIEKELGRPLPLSPKQCYALKDKFNIDVDCPFKRIKRDTLIQALEYILGYEINNDHFKKLRKGIDQQGRKTYNSLSLCQIISNESTAFDKNI